MFEKKVAKLLAPSVPLALEVEGDPSPIRLELRLAWTMRAAITIESSLKAHGAEVNILQSPGEFWKSLDCTRLAIGIWACASQDQPQYADEEGLEVIESFLTLDNYEAACAALKSAFLESLSKKRRDEILKAEAEGSKPAADPQPAPAQQ